MGADFFYAAIPYCDIDESRIRVLREVLAEVPDKELIELDENILLFGEDDGGAITADHIRNRLLELVGELDDTRETDVTRWPDCDYEMLITGGMSWGDTPTDAFDVIAKVGSCDALYSQLMIWAKQDYAKKNDLAIKYYVESIIDGHHFGPYDDYSDAVDTAEAVDGIILQRAVYWTTTQED